MTRLFPNSTTDYGGYLTWASTFGNVAIKERVASYSASFWRMMTRDEWTYLLNTRSVSHVRYHFAVVSGVNGVILYPDAYTPDAAGAPTVTSGATVTAANWRKMQLQGCVFLPAMNTGAWEYTGFYWTSTVNTKVSKEQYAIRIYNSNTAPVGVQSIDNGGGSLKHSVRLVHNL